MKFRIVVLGDLHYGEDPLNYFQKARDEIKQINPSYLIQLGDLMGGGFRGISFLPSVKEYFEGFGCSYSIVIGNHDLNDHDTISESDIINNWNFTFGCEAPYRLLDFDGVMAIILSSTRKYVNSHGASEVYIDDVQLNWLKDCLMQFHKRPFIIFSHCPVLGSGIQVPSIPHLSKKCAWMNHSNEPHTFIEIIKNNPNIKLWFSGHTHLGGALANLVSEKFGCTFVNVGTIGYHSRNGIRSSAFLDMDNNSIEIYTINHTSNVFVEKHFIKRILK